MSKTTRKTASKTASKTTSKTTEPEILISKERGLLKVKGNGKENNKISAKSVDLSISDINPENFYMNGKLSKSTIGNQYGELLYLHKGEWFKPAIALPLMKGCRFYTNSFGITTITGHLSSKDYKHKRTVKRIKEIYNRVLTIIENHPVLKSKKDGFPLTRFIRRKEDGPNGEKIYAITAEIEQTRTVNNSYTIYGTDFADKNGKVMKGNPLSNLKDKEVDVTLLIDISLIKPGQDAIYNKIKADSILIHEAREIVRTRKAKFSFDFSSDDSESDSEESGEDSEADIEDDNEMDDDAGYEEVDEVVDDEVDEEVDDEEAVDNDATE